MMHKIKNVLRNNNMQQREEQKRMQRLQTYDQKHGEAYERIHGLLLR